MAIKEISVCSATDESNSEITICNDPDEDREITICEDCTDPPTLSISGYDAPEIGDYYDGVGGVEPYSFSFNGGVINSSTGQIVSVTGCGGPDGNGAVAQVSVTDACGQTAAMDVRLPGGSWVYNRTDYAVSGEYCYGEYNSLEYHTVIAGGVKTEMHYCTTALSYPYGVGDCEGTTWGCCLYCKLSDLDDYFGGSTVFKKIMHTSNVISQWEC